MAKFILQDWVSELPLRHQGVLLTCVRGPDTAPKEDHVKDLVRAMRCAFLNAHVGDPKKARTFIEWVTMHELGQRMLKVVKSFDHLPLHYLMHLVHGAEVLGYKHPDPALRMAWGDFYQTMCRKFHLNPETEAQMDARLDEPDENKFAERQ